LSTLYSWGHNFDGFLGYGSYGQFGLNQSTPRAVKVNNLQTEIVSTLNVADTHTLVLTQTGKVYGWGDNQYGQLGDGSAQSKPEPTATVLTALAGKTVSFLSATGGYHSFVITTDGLLFGWGRNDLGQLGDGTQISKLTAVPILGLLTGKTITNVVSGADHTIVYTTESKAYAMGGNGFGQAGNKSIGGAISNGAVESIAMNELFWSIGLWPTKIYAGAQTTYFSFSDGSIYSFGTNDWGQLGDGTQKINILGSKLRTDDNGAFFGRKIQSIAVGERHVVVIASNAYTVGLSMMCLFIVALFL
jgi:alpha-tubulin suppressor-like RCC1 family protein